MKVTSAHCRFVFGLLAVVALVRADGRAAPVPLTSGIAKSEEIEKAEAFFKKGDNNAALDWLEKAVKKNPQLPPAKLMMARLFLAAGQGSPTRTMIEGAFVDSPEHPEIYLFNGSVSLQEGRLTDAILNCQTALQLAAGERWTAEQRKNFQKEARAGLAATFEARRDWASARTYLSAWLEADPKNAATRQRLARALFLLGKTDEALAELQTAVKDDKSLDAPEVTMGIFASGAGKTKLAEEWFGKAVQKYPKSVRSHQAFGGWLLDQGRTDAAKLHIETAAQLEPKSRENDKLRGLLARYEKDYATAEKLFDLAYRESPADLFASNQLALVLAESAETKQQERAVQLAEVNARQYPRSGDALATLGWVYFKANRMDDAEKALTASVSGGQASADTAYYLAKVLSQRGKADDAKKLLKQAVESTGVFVNRKAAEKWQLELEKKK
jgi:tetratricopeptide (TPR) repeat protein